jgi:MFS family permease
VSAVCWSGGIAIAASGVILHQLWIMWIGAGVIGGIGLGLGYISPVSTLIQWFPDRRGMATGMAIMGFGGGAMIGAPLANLLMTHFRTPTSVGVWETFLCPRRVVLGFHDGRGVRLSASTSRLATRRSRRRSPERDGDAPPRAPAAGAQDAAVLADLGGALPECQRRHRA